MSLWEEKFNKLQSQYESMQNEYESKFKSMQQQNDSMQKELEKFKRDKTSTPEQMYHGMIIHKK